MSNLNENISRIKKMMGLNEQVKKSALLNPKYKSLFDTLSTVGITYLSKYGGEDGLKWSKGGEYDIKLIPSDPTAFFDIYVHGERDDNYKKGKEMTILNYWKKKGYETLDTHIVKIVNKNPHQVASDLMGLFKEFHLDGIGYSTSGVSSDPRGKKHPEWLYINILTLLLGGFFT